MLPPLLDCLRKSGAESEDISIVIALGTHRSMTASEIKTKIGREILNTYQIVNVPCEDDRQMIPMGMSSHGIPAWVNRKVAEAETRIGVGMITPHMDTGFSGGAKIILPGVCSCRTVDAFHSRQAKIAGNQLGVVEAPMRIELEEFVSERVGLDFILNAILNRDGSLYRCVAGHFIQAHRVGVGFAKEVYGVPIQTRYPLVISNAFPAQIDLWQSTKGIASGELMTMDGGTLILVTHCREGNRTHPLFKEYLGKNYDQLIHKLEGGLAEDPVACALAVSIVKMKERIRIALVSSGLGLYDANQMGFGYYDSVEAALDDLLNDQAKQPFLGVLTHGGVTLPILP
jgi:nickel-dependent lactate racemase